jgi:hypothetical protein
VVDRHGSGVAQLRLREAARQDRDRREAGASRRLAVPRRVAHHHGVAGAGLLHRRLDQVGFRLGGLNVDRGGPAVGELAGVEHVEDGGGRHPFPIPSDMCP